MAEDDPLNEDPAPESSIRCTILCSFHTHWKLKAALSQQATRAFGSLWFSVESILQEYYTQYVVPEHFVIWKCRPLYGGLLGISNTMRGLKLPFMNICRVGHGKLDCPGASAILWQEQREVSAYKDLECCVLRLKGLGTFRLRTPRTFHWKQCPLEESSGTYSFTLGIPYNFKTSSTWEDALL